jgi:hypothetical protein
LRQAKERMDARWPGWPGRRRPHYATTDCGRRLWAFRASVRDRDGTATRAKAFWQANGWY